MTKFTEAKRSRPLGHEWFSFWTPVTFSTLAPPVPTGTRVHIECLRLQVEPVHSEVTVHILWRQAAHTFDSTQRVVKPSEPWVKRPGNWGLQKRKTQTQTGLGGGGCDTSHELISLRGVESQKGCTCWYATVEFNKPT